MTAATKILDPCCGSRMFWFDKDDQRTLFGDIRDEQHLLCDGRALNVEPNVIMDFRSLPDNLTWEWISGQLSTLWQPFLLGSVVLGLVLGGTFISQAPVM